MTRKLGVLARAALATAALCLVAGAASMTPAAQQTKQQAKDTAKDQKAMSATAGAIAQNPETYYDKKVEVRAEIEDVLGRQAFVLDEDRLFAWPDVLVIAPPLTGYAPEDEVVTVKGTVERFVDADIRRDYGWNWWDDLDADIITTFRDRPVIMAESIKTSTGTELVRTGTR